MKITRLLFALCLVLAVGFGFAQTPLQRVRLLVTTQTPVHAISAKQAKAIALNNYPGKASSKVKLANENGLWVFLVNIKAGTVQHLVLVNADNGRIENVIDTQVTKAKSKHVVTDYAKKQRKAMQKAIKQANKHKKVAKRPKIKRTNRSHKPRIRH